MVVELQLLYSAGVNKDFTRCACVHECRNCVRCVDRKYKKCWLNDAVDQLNTDHYRFTFSMGVKKCFSVSMILKNILCWPTISQLSYLDALEKQNFISISLSLSLSLSQKFLSQTRIHQYTQREHQQYHFIQSLFFTMLHFVQSMTRLTAS